ncbi:fibronectin type III domain-containing protein [Fodinicola feengrottensis]|uniref:fibronectin type III domain-containing protein n=1 Tax=Fodinicola feengrottensis TaxID=435914 RepID=UPI0013D3A005|nr:fibronectin type III domain-containing protein [Fodinicola feengrottensis]
MDIAVNGTVVAAGTAFPATTNWDTWATKAVNAQLTAGSNTIRATATTANGGPNLDDLTVSGATDSQPPPTTPGTTSCSDLGENQLTLHWGASTDNIGVAAYDIYDHGNKLDEAAGTVTSKVLTGLAPNTTYTLAVTARDAAGNASPATSPLTCTTLPSSDSTPPTAPSGLGQSAVTATSVNLSWTGSTDNGR